MQEPGWKRYRKFYKINNNLPSQTSQKHIRIPMMCIFDFKSFKGFSNPITSLLILGVLERELRLNNTVFNHKVVLKYFKCSLTQYEKCIKLLKEFNIISKISRSNFEINKNKVNLNKNYGQMAPHILRDDRLKPIDKIIHLHISKSDKYYPKYLSRMIFNDVNKVSSIRDSLKRLIEHGLISEYIPVSSF